MGDVVMRSRSTGWRRWIASAAVCAVAVGAGCAVISARRVEASPAPSADAAQSSTTRTKAEAKAAQSTTEIRSLDLREGAPEVFVDLEASAPLVWTSFRNADGRVVVELPNTVPGPKLADLSPEEGLISSLAVQKSEEGSRPLTRLVIATRQEVEHSVTADGMKLRIQLSPVDGKAAAGAPAETPANTGTKVASMAAAAPAAPAPAPMAPPAGKGKLAFEPLPDQPPVAPAAGTSGSSGAGSGAAPVTAAGTPDKPMAGPAPTGSEATRLDSIEVMPASGGAVVKIVGDGEFSYSTFALSSPPRFVIDLRGVINRAARSSQTVDGSVVERVRVAQFRPAPKPVSRVVFDLHGDTLPTIERSGSSLVVSFGAANGAAAAMPAPAPAPAMPATTTASTSTTTTTTSSMPAAEPAPAPAKTTTSTTRKSSRRARAPGPSRRRAPGRTPPPSRPPRRR